MASEYEDLGRTLGNAWAWIVGPKDDWDSVSVPVHHALFGSGSRRPFPWYFGGRTRVGVDSLADVERWLQECTYVDDESLSGQADYWQHPGQFEYVRMGDCDDHALWAWRKLVELGHPTSFVLGRWLQEPDGLHTWLLTTVSGGPHVFEATSKVTGEMLRPFEDARRDYRPYFSVDEGYRTKVHMGWVRDLSPFEPSGVWTQVRGQGR